MVEVLNLTQQRHLANHEGRDSALGVTEEVQLLDRYEALLLTDLPGLEHLAVGALTYFYQDLVAPIVSVKLHAFTLNGLLFENKDIELD